MAKYVFPLTGAAILLGIVAVACGEDVAIDPGLDGGNAGQDGGSDSGKPTAQDAGTDASPDSGPDAGPPPPTPSYLIGGSVTGLKGSGLVLQNNAGDDKTLSADGPFVFASKVDTGKPYNVTIKTQPTAPSQQCSVAGATGTVSSGNVTTVVVNCATDKFTLSGNVTGLAGSGLVLQNSNGDEATVANDGSFAFGTAIDDGTAYAVTVKTQPTNLSQQCTVTNGTGTLSGANVDNLAVTCVTNKFKVGGTVTGLKGSGLVLQNQGGNDYAVSGDGAFEFTTAHDDGSTFAVTVKTNPANPLQQCTVSGDSGTIAGGNVSSVVVNCATDKFVIGGTVSGLEGSGLVLRNNGSNDRVITANGDFAFTTPLDDLASYDVTVSAQPTNKWQTCTVTNPTGNVAAAEVTNIAVVCTTNEYKVKAKVSGLQGTGLVIQNNGGSDIAVAGDGTFEFATAIPSGSGYFVSVLTNPHDKSQTCTVSNESGTIAGADVDDVQITCTTNHYSISGSISGLAAGNDVVLQNNGGDDLKVDTNGNFTFTGGIESGQTFTVSVLTQPTTPSQTCIVTGETGTVAAGNVESVVVNCSTNEYTVSGNVTGLDGTGLVLQNNGGHDVTQNANGGFSFPAQQDQTSYAVTVKTQPTAKSQTCTVQNGTGNLAGTSVSDVQVTCVTNEYDVGGTIGNLNGTIVLTNNGGDDLTLDQTQNGSFKFATQVARGGSYAVAVKTQPAGQTCTPSNASGTVTASAVTSIVVTCTCVAGQVNSGGTCITPPTGGTITNVGGYRIHTFTSSGNFVVPTGLAVQYLVVAGGGGGGAGDGAGGGAGGLLQGSTSLSAATFPIVVGPGGSGGTGEVGVQSQNGQNSSFSSFVAIGGGRGGQEGNYNGIPHPWNIGGDGGSGGGFGGCNPLVGNDKAGSGVTGQGNAGGIRFASDSARCGMGGGGGAGGVGGTGTNANGGGTGGIGIQSSISGTPKYYAGGGGGSSRGPIGLGGNGGGGNGGNGTSGTSGTANTGGGGGGGGDQGTSGGSGGSGVVIIRYPVTP